LDSFEWAQNDREKKIALIKLALKYKLQMFVEFVQKTLIQMGPGTMEMLAVADQLALIGLKVGCNNVELKITQNIYSHFQ
jgi:hypothetical protein